MINRSLGGKRIVLNGESSTNAVFIEVVMEGYTYVFISLEIAISKKFKKYLLDCFFFTNHLYLLAINEIYLLEEWSKSFRQIFAESEKI